MTRTLPSLVLAFALVVLLTATSVAAQQQGSIRFSIHDKDGKPLADVQLVLVLANQNKVAAGTTDNSGNGNVALNIANLGKVRMQVYEEKCPDNRTTIIITPEGQEHEQDPRCKCRKLVGGFWWDGGQTVTIDLGKGTVEVTHGGSVTGLPGRVPVWFQFSGGPGVKTFPGASSSCTAFSQVFPGASCGSSDKSFSFNVEGSVHFWHLVARGGYFRANGVQLNASGAVPGGTDSLQRTNQPEAGFATAGLCVPLGSRASLVLDEGAAFWRDNLDFKETVTVGSTTTVSRDSIQATGVGPMLGGAVHFDATRHLGFEVRYAYVQMKDKPQVNEHNHMIFFNLTVRLPGK